MAEYGIVYKPNKLQQLIKENPELPIVILAGEEANSGEYAWQYCTCIDCALDTILDIRTPYDNDGEHVFTDEDEFLEAIEESLYDCNDNMTDQEITEAAKREAEQYAGCWRKVIAIYVNN